MTREWNHDMSRAPRGRYRLVPSGRGNATRKVFEPSRIFVAGKCGTVTVSYWVDEEKRWSLFTAAVPPVAWMTYEGSRQITDDQGRTRQVVDFPDHPSEPESWFDAFMRDRKLTGVAAQQECLDWIANRSAAA